MSDFSCSYHLRTECFDDCVNLIKRANVIGYVFPLRNGWVSFVINEPDFTFSKKLIDANDGIILNFINAEDHGWSFEIYSKSHRVCNFECEFGMTDDFDFVSETSHGVYVEKWEELFDNKQSLILAKAFKINDKSLPEEVISADDFADGMGLYFYEWIAYNYISRNFNAFTTYGEYENLKIIEVK